MAMRSVAVSRSGISRLMETNRRYFSSESKGRVLGEEERAQENVFIQKWERERLEKQRLKAEKEKAEQEKAGKKAEGEAHKS